MTAGTIEHNMPPYGRCLLNWHPHPAGELRLYFGSAMREIWNHARTRNRYAPPALILPHGSGAESFSWPVSNWPVLAIQCGYHPTESIPELARLLLQNGALIVRVLYGDKPDMATFRPVYRETQS